MSSTSKPRHLHAELKPGPRVDTLFLELVFPALESLGFSFLKSQRSIRKKNDFFDYLIRWNSSKFNEGNISVDFDLGLYVYAPSYRRWGKKFYQLEKNWSNPISAKALSMIPNWDYTYYQNDWYDLVKNDNILLMEKVRDNLLGPGMDYFNNFRDLAQALAYLKAEAPHNLEITLDLYIMHEQLEAAYQLFKEHLAWYEAQEKSKEDSPYSIYAYNRSQPLTQRKDLLNAWARQKGLAELV